MRTLKDKVPALHFKVLNQMILLKKPRGERSPLLPLLLDFSFLFPSLLTNQELPGAITTDTLQPSWWCQGKGVYKSQASVLAIAGGILKRVNNYWF